MVVRYGQIVGAVLLFAAVIAAGSRGAAQPLYQGFLAPTEPLTPAEQQKRFHLPPGFEIQLVAAEPEIRKPVNLNFDARGRLLVTQSVEYPVVVPQDKTPRDTINVLVDTDHDGTYDEVRTLADRLNIPVGITPSPGGMMAYVVPNIYRFRDEDERGRAQRREVVFQGFGFEDTHGMPNSFTWWIDGWIYACHGEGNTSTVTSSDGQSLTMQGGNTFRMKPDGSRIEPFTHGQANPFGFCFDPLGNAYAADSHSKPGYMLLRGAWYPSLKREHDGLGFGPEFMRHYHRSTGIAGIAYYAAEHFPSPYRDTLFIGNPVTGRINHDRLEAHGSTYTATEQPDFLTCDDTWFRPVDIQLGPDGALYIADFYNRIIGHNVVPLSHAQRDHERGRIWRVVFKGNEDNLHPTADLTAVSLEKLIGFLGSANLLVRTQATHELVQRIGTSAIEPVKRLIFGDSNAWQRAHGLWVLHRLDALDDGVMLRLSQDSAREVRLHLAKAVGQRRDWRGARSVARRSMLDFLSDPDAFVRRAAAEALGQHPQKMNIGPLLDLWSSTPLHDTHLIHVVRMALRDNFQAMGDIEQVSEDYARQVDTQRRLADISLGLRTEEASRFLLDHLQSGNVESQRLGEFVHHAARYLDSDSLSELYLFAKTFQTKESSRQQSVLKALNRAAQERGSAVPQEISQWGLRIAEGLLLSDDEFTVYGGIELARELKLKELGDKLAQLAVQSSDSAIRSMAMDALTAIDGELALNVLKSILQDVTEPLDVRDKAADTLGKLDDDRGRRLLAQQLEAAPLGLTATIARRLALTPDGAELLLAAIGQGKASPHLLQDAVVDLRLHHSNVPRLVTRRAQLLLGLPAEDQRLITLVQQRRVGFAVADVKIERGAKIFEKHCAACHKIGDNGGDVGPRLDGAGLRGLERLLEDVLMPNRNVDLLFRSSVLRMADGRVVTGLVLREEGNSLLVADERGKESRISKNDVKQLRLSQLSAMPANTIDSVPEPEFYDLIGFLLDQRRKVQTEK